MTSSLDRRKRFDNPFNISYTVTNKESQTINLTSKLVIVSLILG